MFAASGSQSRWMSTSEKSVDEGDSMSEDSESPEVPTKAGKMKVQTLDAMGFFKHKPTPEWSAEQKEKQKERDAKNRQKLLELERKAAIARAETVQQGNRERKRKSRALKREEEIRDGQRSPGGSKRQRVCFNLCYVAVRLIDHDAQKQEGEHVFEGTVLGSRTQTVSGNAIASDIESGGSKRIDWFHPIRWSQISAAADRVCVRTGGMSPRAIIKELKALNPEEFKSITEQWVGRYIECVETEEGEKKTQWSKKALERANMAQRTVTKAKGTVLYTGIIVRLVG